MNELITESRFVLFGLYVEKLKFWVGQFKILEFSSEKKKVFSCLKFSKHPWEVMNCISLEVCLQYLGITNVFPELWIHILCAPCFLGISVCKEGASYGFFVFLYFYLEGKCLCGFTYRYSAGQGSEGTPFSKGQIGDFSTSSDFFHPFYSSIAPVFMDPLELYKMQFAVYDCFTFEPWDSRIG